MEAKKENVRVASLEIVLISLNRKYDEGRLRSAFASFLSENSDPQNAPMIHGLHSEANCQWGQLHIFMEIHWCIILSILPSYKHPQVCTVDKSLGNYKHDGVKPLDFLFLCKTTLLHPERSKLYNNFGLSECNRVLHKFLYSCSCMLNLYRLMATCKCTAQPYSRFHKRLW